VPGRRGSTNGAYAFPADMIQIAPIAHQVAFTKIDAASKSERKTLLPAVRPATADEILMKFV